MSNPTDTRHTLWELIRQSVRVARSYSGMVLSVAFAVVLIVMSYADSFIPTGDGSTEGNMALFVPTLVGFWFMVSGLWAFDALPRINKSFSGAAGMMWWNRWATLAGYTLVVLGFAVYRWGLPAEGTVTTPGRNEWPAYDVALLTLLCLMAVAGMVRFVGPNIRPRYPKFFDDLGRWNSAISYDGAYAVYCVTLVALWVAVAVQLWCATPLTSAVGDGTINRPWQVACYGLVVGIGLLAVLRVLIWQQVRSDRRYPGTVVQVVRPDEHTAIITVELDEIVERGRPKSYWYTAGQYSYLGVPGSPTTPHPFTMTSIPNVVGRSGPTVNVGVEPRLRTQGIAWDRTIEYCVKAAGKGSQWLVENVEPGRRVTVSTPRGGTHPARGGAEQLWAAAGIGVTPFVAWLRDIEAMSAKNFPGNVVFVWSYFAEDEVAMPAHVDYVRRCAAEWEWLTLVEVNTAVSPRIRPEECCEMAFPELSQQMLPMLDRDASVFLCGPTHMCVDFRNFFLAKGMPPHQIYTDGFHSR